MSAQQKELENIKKYNQLAKQKEIEKIKIDKQAKTKLQQQAKLSKLQQDATRTPQRSETDTGMQQPQEMSQTPSSVSTNSTQQSIPSYDDTQQSSRSQSQTPSYDDTQQSSRSQSQTPSMIQSQTPATSLYDGTQQSTMQRQIPKSSLYKRITTTPTRNLSIVSTSEQKTPPQYIDSPTVVESPEDSEINLTTDVLYKIKNLLNETLQKQKHQFGTHATRTLYDKLKILRHSVLNKINKTVFFDDSIIVIYQAHTHKIEIYQKNDYDHKITLNVQYGHTMILTHYTMIKQKEICVNYLIQLIALFLNVHEIIFKHTNTLTFFHDYRYYKLNTHINFRDIINVIKHHEHDKLCHLSSAIKKALKHLYIAQPMEK